jgi:3-hydroxyisobutyrate dehydrogenase-like beta-hydroxyacid dehydrogenase
MKPVAVLGSGRMGAAIARRLHESQIEVLPWDRTRTKAESLNLGRVAESPGQAAQEADIIISMVTGPQAISDIYFGPAGVLQAAAGKTIVDMSTAGPQAAQDLQAAAADKGASFIAAPVIGSVPAVNSGSLVILAGAAHAEDIDLVRPVLQQLGEVHYVGAPRDASALKLIANSMLAIVSAASAELLSAAAQHGLRREEVFWLLSRVAPGLKVREAGFLRNVHEPTMFAVRDIVKDLDLALGLYESDSGPRSKVPITALTRELFAGVAATAPNLDISAIVTAYSSEPSRAEQKKDAR